MFFRLFGNYLRDKELLSEEQVDSLMQYRKENRVKLGMLAVNQGLMTISQAEEVNRLQALQDKRFGTIAIEKGFLTEAQMEGLIAKQGNPFFLFLQAMEELGFLTKENINEQLVAFREENRLTAEQLEVVKSGTVDEVSDLFLTASNAHAEGLLKLAIRNLVRFVSTDICFEQISEVSRMEAGQLAAQKVVGPSPMLLGFTSENNELLELACIYGKEEFQEMDADAFDAVCEFINCNNGLYARTHSTLLCEMELLPPTFATDTQMEGKLFVLPITVNNKKMTVFVQID